MKKILYLVVITVFSLGMALIGSKELSAKASLRADHPEIILADKRCEKCERGDDGKIVCKPVPCPK